MSRGNQKVTVQGFDDVKFLKDFNRWPNWPVCPVKKRVGSAGDMPICGLVFDGHTYVKELYMFVKWTPEEFDAAKTHTYESIEAMVADGWEVD